MTAHDLMTRARGGDGHAFRDLVEPYRRELHVHCYRMLGSVHDADDALQETLLAAWQGLGAFEGRASMRTWLYRVATSRCLNARRSAARRPAAARAEVTPPPPTRIGDVTWLEPYPDRLLDDLADPAPGPEARYETYETLCLAFVTALQTLPPRQRAVLVLRDVLGYPASDVAGMLATTASSVTSALKRARAGVQRRLDDTAAHEPPPGPGTAAEADLVARLSRAFETGDVAGIVTLLTDDVWMTMPPMPLEYQGRANAAGFLTIVAFRPGRRFRILPTRANRQPALAVYLREPHARSTHANGLIVLTLAGRKVSALTRFDAGTFPQLGLPRRLPDPARGR